MSLHFRSANQIVNFGANSPKRMSDVSTNSLQSEFKVDYHFYSWSREQYISCFIINEQSPFGGTSKTRHEGFAYSVLPMSDTSLYNPKLSYMYVCITYFSCVYVCVCVCVCIYSLETVVRSNIHIDNDAILLTLDRFSFTAF